MGYFRYGPGKFFGRTARPFQDTVVVFFAQFIEKIRKDAPGQRGRRIIGFLLELQQQALLQRQGAHTRRVESLDDLQDLPDFFFRSFYGGGKGQVVRNGLQIPA